MEIKTERLRASMLTLQCAKCTRTRTFGVSGPEDGRIEIARAGWIDRDGLKICPRCPQTRAEITARVKVAHA
jgi:hypothetical protein